MIRWRKTQIVGSDGVLVSKILEIVSSVIPNAHALCSGIECAGVVSSFENKLMPVESLIKSSLNVIQFDWGDVFLVSGKKIDSDLNVLEDDLPVIISKCFITVRIIDSSYIEIFYTQSSLEGKFEILQGYKFTVEGDLFVDFDYPE